MAPIVRLGNVLQLNLIVLPMPMAINPTQINRDSIAAALSAGPEAVCGASMARDR